MARMDVMTMKMDAQYKYFQSRLKSNPDHNDDDIPMSREEEAKFMQTFRRTRFYNDYRDCNLNRDNWRSSGRNGYNRANYQSHSDDKPNLQKQLSDFIITQHSANSFIKDTFMDLKNKLETTTKNHQAPIQNLKAKFDIFADKQSGRPSRSLLSNTQPSPKELEEDSKVPLILGRHFIHTANAVIRVKQKQLNLGVGTERMIFQIDSAMKHSHSNDDTCFSIDVIDKILEEDLDALLDEGSEILHSIEGTILEEKLFAEFNEFITMTADENSKSKSDTKVPPFEKITFNSDYKIKTSLEEPPMDLELKPLPDNPEYVFLEEPYFLPVIISSQLSFDHCLNNLDKMLQLCKDAHLALNWEKCHFMVKEGIVLGHKVSEAGLEVEKAKIEAISKIPPPLISKVSEAFRDMPISTEDSLKFSQKSPILSQSRSKKILHSNSKKILHSNSMMNITTHSRY
nr:reverse transcriptase domain-containing protein [Tanacetum cinerariifolium]